MGMVKISRFNLYSKIIEKNLKAQEKAVKFRICFKFLRLIFGV